MIVTQFDNGYYEWGLLFAKSLHLTNPGRKVYMDTLNLSDEQIDKLKSVSPLIEVNNNRIVHPPDRNIPAFMTNRRVEVLLNVVKKTDDQDYLLIDADMLFRKSLRSLYRQLEHSDACVVFRDGVWGDRTYEHLKVAGGFVLIKRSGIPLIEKWYEMMTTKDCLYGVKTGEWYWDQITLLEATKTVGGLKIGAIEPRLYINRDFDFTAYVWSANKAPKDKMLSMFRLEYDRISREGICVKFTNTLAEGDRRKNGNQSGLNDRKWLEGHYYPSLEGSVLQVGVARYTDFYHTLVKCPSQFITVDVNFEVAKYGSPYGHYIDSAQSFLSQTDKVFDNIVLYGIFGQKHTIIDKRQIMDIVDVSCENLRDGGTLLVGLDGGIVDSFVFRQTKIKSMTVIEEFMITPSPAHAEVYILWVRK